MIIDAIGNADLTERSIPLLKAGGTFANYSFPTTEKRTVSLDMGLFVRKELNYIGTTFQHHSFSKCLAAMADGKIDPELTITHTFPLDRYFEALDTNWSDPTSIKIIIEPNGHL